ncbi:MAG: hypothetical protein U0136_10475 [Bdellovibrionota bacterium]
MRRIFFAVSLCCSVPGSTQLAYSQTAGTAAAKNEQPFFGGQVKTAKEKALDDAFVRSSIKAAGNRDLALTELIERGFEAIAQRDPKTAMKRFNQASLINADDYRVYWGFAAATGLEGNFSKSIELFRSAELLKSDDPHLLCDSGYSLMASAMYQIGNNRAKPNDPKMLEMLRDAEAKFQHAATLDKQSALPHSLQAILAFYRDDGVRAWQEVHKAKQLGGEGLDPKFVDDLKKTIPEPSETASK